MDDNQTLPLAGTEMNMRSIQEAVVYMLLTIYRRSSSFRSLAIHISNALSSEHCRCMHDEIPGDIFLHIHLILGGGGLKFKVKVYIRVSLALQYHI